MSKVPRVGKVAGPAALVATLTVALVSGSAGASVQTAAQLGPQVAHTGKGPTGYTVTFRISDPAATSMRIKGTWTFASEESESTDPTNATPISAADWKPGDFPLQSPDSPGEAWAIADMTKDPRTGIWSSTVPLPSGSWDYQFYPDCPAAAGSVTGCTAITDPANPGWNSTGSPAVFSQVYVPSDAKFGTADMSWVADAPAGHRGTLAELSYPTTMNTTGSDQMVVYTPPGYDPHRAQPYPLFVLSHGGGENEITWSTRGRVAQILDNLILRGKIQPMVVAMPSGVVSAGSTYADEITQSTVPFLEQNYDVSTNAADRAYAGTSAYGSQANNFLFNQTAEFGYYGVWSPAAGAPPITVTGQGPAPTAPAYQVPALKQTLGIHLAIGAFDLGGNAPMLTASTERGGLINAGVPFTYFSVGGGHTWTFWQLALRDFLLRVGFRTTSTAVTADAAGSVATVTPASGEPTTPTGTVQFQANGQNLGGPVKLVNGKATLERAASDRAGVTAVYSGNAYYNGSTSPAMPAS